MTTLDDYNARAGGIAWIREEDYDACIRIFDDGHMFQGTWKDWEKRAEEVEAHLKSKGIITIRVYVDPETFPAWCAARGLDTGREGRLAYGSEEAAKKYGTNQS